VVIIDDLDGADDSDEWQDDDGFQEVTSRKRKKETRKQEQEAAAMAAAMEAAQTRKDKPLLATAKVTSHRVFHTFSILPSLPTTSPTALRLLLRMSIICHNRQSWAIHCSVCQCVG